MWLVLNRSTGVVAFSSLQRAFAEQWLQDNNTGRTGKTLSLYAIKRAKKQ